MLPEDQVPVQRRMLLPVQRLLVLLPVLLLQLVLLLLLLLLLDVVLRCYDCKNPVCAIHWRKGLHSRPAALQVPVVVAMMLVVVVVVVRLALAA